MTRASAMRLLSPGCPSEPEATSTFSAFSSFQIRPRPVHHANAAPADLAQDLVLFPDHGARLQSSAGAQCGAVTRAEPDVVTVAGGASGADLHSGRAYRLNPGRSMADPPGDTHFEKIFAPCFQSVAAFAHRLAHRPMSS